MTDKLTILNESLSKYEKGSKDYLAYLEGHKEANKYLIDYIEHQENKEAYADLKQGAERVLKAIGDM